MVLNMDWIFKQIQNTVDIGFKMVIIVIGMTQGIIPVTLQRETILRATVIKQCGDGNL